jgi:Cu/Ag efflux protein CusF
MQYRLCDGIPSLSSTLIKRRPEMRALLASVTLVVAALMPWPIAAQTSEAVIGKGPGVAGAAQTTKIAATITAIDAATRAVTLKGPQGNQLTIAVGPDVKNFAQMKVGDQVNVEYIEALTLELKKGSTAPVARSDQAAAGSAKPGERPAGAAGRQVTVTAEVVGLDPAAQTVTLRGPQRTVELKVRDPEQFKRVAKGDRVEATYTEALVVAVEPAKK